MHSRKSNPSDEARLIQTKLHLKQTYLVLYFPKFISLNKIQIQISVYQLGGA